MLKSEDALMITQFKDGGDTVTVGGYPVPIYSDKNGEIYEGDDKQAGTYIEPDYSVQPIIGLKENGTGYTTSNEIHFFGLPKYDQSGAAVSYTVEELWMKKTNNGWVEVTDDDLKSYTGLYELWAPYNSVKTGDEYQEDVIGQDQLDLQSITVTNSRGGTKEVTWTKDWRDNFTNESGLRPDVYLQIYSVVHVQTGTNNEGKPIYERRIQEYGTSGNWVKDDDNTWTLRLNLPAYDDYGFEIFYYAVEQTSQPAQDYDYQMPEYYRDKELKQPLGNANDADDDATVLKSDNCSEPGDYAYDLLLLNPATNSEDSSIPWNVQVPPTFAETFPTYALLENGTFSNTLAEDYSIEGMKYWTSLPVGWLDEGKGNLPGVRFIVYRYVDSDKLTWTDTNGDGKVDLDDVIKGSDGEFLTDKECKYYAAQLTIPSEQWESLRSGTGYQYLIKYNGFNSLTSEDGKLVCQAVDAEGNELTDPEPLERYDENGSLYTYEIREVVQWDPGVTVDGDQVFTVSNSSNGFYFTNTYDPDKGSIKVKKFLYLPMETKADGTKAPTAYPAVTFKLVREVDYGNGYVPDTSFATQTVTITSAEVKEAWNAPSFVATMPDYVTLYAQFDNLPIYAPNGTQYYYTVIEDRDELQGYDTWADEGDIATDQFTSDPLDGTAYPSAGVTDGVAITGLKPTKVDEGQEPPPDLKSAATFKNKQPDTPKTYNEFTATKIWEDYGDDNFRPTVEQFEEILKRELLNNQEWSALKRTAPEQSGQDNEMSEYLYEGTDYTLEVEVNSSDPDKYEITIKPTKNTSFDLYAPNGMPWTYTFSEPVVNNRLQLTNTPSDKANFVYAPKTGNNGQWPTQIKPQDPQNTDFGELTNTIHLQYQFQKKWVDEDDHSITEDYLGFDLTVKFQLQVAEVRLDANGQVDWSNLNWKYANDYFQNNHLQVDIGITGANETNGDTATITGRVNAAKWGTGGAFTNLPTARQDENGKYILLQYRVIETEVSYGDNQKQAITDLTLDTGSGEKQTGDYEVEDYGTKLVTSATFERTDHALSISTNKLNTTSVSVTKVWDDTNNLYGTRPGANGPWSWTSWFVLQRTTDSTDWENVAIFDSLYGSDDASNPNTANSGNWVATISGLPVADYKNGGASYTYRVRELQPKDGGYQSADGITDTDIVEPGGTYNPSGFNYTTTYTEPSGEENLWTVTNALGDTPITDEIQAVKEWVGEDKNGSISGVTFRLEYTLDGTNWDTVDFLGDGASAELIANEGNDWTVTWTTLPSNFVDKEGCGTQY